MMQHHGCCSESKDITKKQASKRGSIDKRVRGGGVRRDKPIIIIFTSQFTRFWCASLNQPPTAFKNMGQFAGKSNDWENRGSSVGNDEGQARKSRENPISPPPSPAAPVKSSALPRCEWMEEPACFTFFFSGVMSSSSRDGLLSRICIGSGLVPDQLKQPPLLAAGSKW